MRFAFRERNGLPGTFAEDLQLSTPWVACLPCYAAPDGRPMQCSWPFQLALMDSAISGADKAAAPPPPPRGPPAPGGERWSSDLFGCTCTPECGGSAPLLGCSFAYGWWMQTRIMKRVGRTPLASFWGVACGLFVLEGLLDLVDFVIEAASLAGSALEVVLNVAARVPITAINCWLRRTVRERYNIREDWPLQDLFISFCFYPCSIAQLDRELTARGEDV